MMMVSFLIVFFIIIFLGIVYHKYSTEIDPYTEVPAGYIDEQLEFHTIFLKTLSFRHYEGYNILTPKVLLPKNCNCFWINTKYQEGKSIDETYIPLHSYPNSKQPSNEYLLFSVRKGEILEAPFGLYYAHDELSHDYYIIRKNECLYLIHRDTVTRLLKKEEKFSVVAASLSPTSYSSEHFKLLDRIR